MGKVGKHLEWAPIRPWKFQHWHWKVRPALSRVVWNRLKLSGVVETLCHPETFEVIQIRSESSGSIRSCSESSRDGVIRSWSCSELSGAFQSHPTLDSFRISKNHPESESNDSRRLHFRSTPDDSSGCIRITPDDSTRLQIARDDSKSHS